MRLMAANITGFGSRFNVILDPHKKRIQHGTLGMYLERESELIVGVESDGTDGSYLPLSDMANHFQSVVMSMRMNSLTYTAINLEGGYELAFTLTSPFIPEDKKLIAAPFLYVDAAVKRRTRSHHLLPVKKKIGPGRIVFGIRGEGLSMRTERETLIIDYTIPSRMPYPVGDSYRHVELLAERDGKVPERFPCHEVMVCPGTAANGAGLFEVPFNLDETASVTARFIWATHVDDELIRFHGEPCKLIYNRYFKTADDVVAYALKHEKAIRKKSAFFEDVIAGSSLSQTWKDFIPYTFQTFKMNVLYGVTRRDKETFAVWEGNCTFNSTMDVEYNDGLFYYAFFPSLLKTQFDNWARTAATKDYIDHDMGSGFLVGPVRYSRPMEIEENSNFILMFATYLSWFGDSAALKRHYGTLKRLAHYIISCDTTGNGLPNKGTFNTVDDASPAIHGTEQTYLGVKSACALTVFARLAGQMKDHETRRKAEAHAAKAMVTIDKKLWFGDHYGVCLDSSLEGHDAYSIYAGNGMLYPFMAGQKIEDCNLKRLTSDIQQAFINTETPFGCYHSSSGCQSAWMSQNLWRDFVAAYLGLDMLDHVAKYWEFQQLMNTDGKLNLFIDTYGENDLSRYPRGLASLGVLFAMLRLQIDGQRKRITIAPLRTSLRIPLTVFADWKKLQIPWVVVENGKLKEIENRHLLKGWKLAINSSCPS